MQTTLDGIRDIRLYQRKDGYRFSLDALLLHSFVNMRDARKIADLGAGSGIVGILLAKRYPRAEVALIELQESLFGLAEKNIALNGLDDRVKALLCDIRSLPSGPSSLAGFDLAVSNPPFRKPLSGRLNVEKERAIARHEIELSLRELVVSASRMLKERGRFCLIYLPLRLPELFAEMKGAGLEPKRMRLVYGTLGSEAKMALVEAVRGGKPGLKAERPLIVYKEDGSYSDEIREIYGE